MAPEAYSNGESPEVSKDEKTAAVKRQLGIEEGQSVAFNADDELLASLGYRSELKREFKYITVFGQSFGVSLSDIISDPILIIIGYGYCKCYCREFALLIG